MPTASLLHISDLHYASPGSNYSDDNKADVPVSLRATYFNNLRRLLKQGFGNETFDAIALTGDFTTQGQAAGFTYFEEDLFPHLKKLVASSDAICAVPGNHDVVWNLDVRNPAYFDEKFGPYKASIARCKITTSLIPSGALPSDPLADFIFEKLPGPLFCCETRKLAILCINSSIRCGEINATMRQKLKDPLQKAEELIEKVLAANRGPNDTTGYLALVKSHLSNLVPWIDKYSLFDIPHVTQVQTDQIGTLLDEKRAATADWEDWIKVVALHHHVAPFDNQLPEYKAFEIMPDASNLVDMLADFGFRIILTGHKHQPYKQRIQSHGRDLLVLGGMTVGGYPVTGYSPSIRRLDVEQSNGILRVSVADLACNDDGDVRTNIRDSISLAKSKPQFLSTVVDGAARTGQPFPKEIESATDSQLYCRSFFKKHIVFEIKVTKSDTGDLIFDTTMSYEAVNRTSSTDFWCAEYNFDASSGKVMSASVAGEEYDPGEPDCRSGRGISIKRRVDAHTGIPVRIQVRERWAPRGSSVFTSYHPATDFKLVLQNQASNIQFDCEVLYFWDNKPVRKNGGIEVTLDKGLLPYQGVRLSWKQKENPVEN